MTPDPEATADVDAKIVFVDFEASSLAKASYPIEVAWAFCTGETGSHLIRPAPTWIDWSPKAQAIHGIARSTLLAEGEPHEQVARRMLAELSGHRLYASAPSWDGKWLSLLLRTAGLPRHALRLLDTEEAHRSAIKRIFTAAGVPETERRPLRDAILARAARRQEDAPPAHRALADARMELDLWRRICDFADEAAVPFRTEPSR